MQRFKSPGSAQRFLSAFSMISPHVRPRRHLLGAAAYRQEMRARLRTWREVTQTEAVGETEASGETRLCCDGGEKSLISLSLLINNLASRVNVTTPLYWMRMRPEEPAHCRCATEPWARGALIAVSDPTSSVPGNLLRSAITERAQNRT